MRVMPIDELLGLRRKSKADNEEILGRAGEARTWEFVKAAEREERD
jgi:hypothetical protein